MDTGRGEGINQTSTPFPRFLKEKLKLKKKEYIQDIHNNNYNYFLKRILLS
jgi:hypothetical protein